jgi:hypothetical protein
VGGERDPAETPPATPTPPRSQSAPPPAAPPPEDTTPAWRFWAKVAALLFFVGYSVAFILGNSKSISVDFVFSTARVSLIWSVLLLLSVGFVAGLLASHLYRQRRRKQPRKS